MKFNTNEWIIVRGNFQLMMKDECGRVCFFIRYPDDKPIPYHVGIRTWMFFEILLDISGEDVKHEN